MANDEGFEGQAKVGGTKFSARGRGFAGTLAGLVFANIVAIVVVSWLASAPDSSSALWLTNGLFCGSLLFLLSLFVRVIAIRHE